MKASQEALLSWSLLPFAEEFFPSTVGVTDTNFYCKYDDRVLQTFASIMHFTGALAAFPAGYW